jgi:peroxiredoxin
MRYFWILAVLGGLVGCKPAGPSDRAKDESGASETKEASIVLLDSEGKPCEPLADDGRKGTVLIFLMSDCPVANASAPALARLGKEFTEQGINFYGIYTTETVDEIATHLREYRLPFPGLSDPELRLATMAEATRVPEAAVFSPEGELIYRGRIDDRAVSLGVVRPKPRREDLRLALEALLAGKKPEVPFTETVGCYLPFPLEESP